MLLVALLLALCFLVFQAVEKERRRRRFQRIPLRIQRDRAAAARDQGTTGQ